jgi:Tfp pilus assembly protein FimV
VPSLGGASERIKHLFERVSTTAAGRGSIVQAFDEQVFERDRSRTAGDRRREGVVRMSAITMAPRVALTDVRRPASAPRPAVAPRRTAVGRPLAADRAEPGLRDLHLTRRGRAVLLLLAALIVLAGVLGGRAVADGPEQAIEVRTYAVQAGETLWQIAGDVALPGEDVRDAVLRLQELNGLADASLRAGQVLLLPADS